MTEPGRSPRISVIVPTRDRPGSLKQTLAPLLDQDLPLADYEIVVVDDGSSPPVRVAVGAPACTVVRLEGAERSAARNRGAEAARGNVLLFVDDDITVGRGFVRSHLEAHAEWPGALVVGSVAPPSWALETPLGRFKHGLETRTRPRERGLTSSRNFCAASNLSVERSIFHRVEGFDPLVRSGEDQDLALRHTAAGGTIAFLPEARGIHRDEASDIAAWCRRAEWGSDHLIPFCRKHPDWPDNVQRHAVNGPLRLGREPLVRSAGKVAKSLLAFAPLFPFITAMERIWPEGRFLRALYRVALGTSIQRGYRAGLRRDGPWADP